MESGANNTASIINPATEKESQKVCNICYETLASNSAKTDCGHEFCFSCLIKTVQYDNGFKCPNCRKDWSIDNEYSENLDDISNILDDDSEFNDPNNPTNNATNESNISNYMPSTIIGKTIYVIKGIMIEFAVEFYEFSKLLITRNIDPNKYIYYRYLNYNRFLILIITFCLTSIIGTDFCKLTTISTAKLVICSIITIRSSAMLVKMDWNINTIYKYGLSSNIQTLNI